MQTEQPDLLISIVSHNHGSQVEKLLGDIESYCKDGSISVIITVNTDEILPFNPENYPFPVKLIVNEKARGFAANHNQAFKMQGSRYFCVLNPDVRLLSDPFAELIKGLSDDEVGVVAPLITSSNGRVEDNTRYLPLPGRLHLRLFWRKNEYLIKDSVVEIDWAAGMFLIFNSELFQRIKGFDEKFFLYCEDIDICTRVWLSGRKVVWLTSVRVVHDAQRSSRRKFKYLIWHITSYLKLFSSGVYYKRLMQKKGSHHGK